ncbi:MAG: S46 family peptidase [Bacteroidales bacterium]
MSRKFVFFLVVFFGLFVGAYGGEGMWIPSLLQEFNIDDMHEKGFRLSADEIYSINNSSLKDAVVIFGGGCTGEVISDKGLLLTNHHCGYSYIQKHSTVEHNYLEDGFWAGSKKEELVTSGLTATFLVRIEDVTEQVVENINEDMTEAERQEAVDETTDELEEEATEGTHYEAVTRPFYYGNEYYMFIYETYKDVRLVGTPPSSIGKFGGDGDNWMWPRHTGDFSVFRIYADENNEPAEYSEDNVPYEPEKHLSISLKGYEKGDFTMIMGYPGSTDQFLTSHAVSLIQDYRNPHRISLRDKRLEVMEKYMNRSDSIKLKYASKQSGVSNSWKRWKGEVRGLKRLKAVEKKENQEKNFRQWVDEKSSREQEYGGLIESFKRIYQDYKPTVMARDYWHEAGYYAIELVRFASRWNALANVDDKEQVDRAKSGMNIQDFYGEYVPAIDRDICPQMLRGYHENVREKFHPRIFQKIEEEFNGNFQKYTNHLFNHSMFVDSAKASQFLENFELEDTTAIMEDPAYKLADSFLDTYRRNIISGYNQYNTCLDSMYRIYVRGLRSMQEDKDFWPDANFTMRVAYGKVKGYHPRDAVVYDYQTTLDGVMEKNQRGLKDYRIPDKLRKLYEEKQYGRYSTQDGRMPVCFIASNHTSGGNSGSPVINANGELIGINFDRNWEGTMSDIMYDPEQCRNIAVDIRYVLFIIDRFAEADHLVEEMTVVK